MRDSRPGWLRTGRFGSPRKRAATCGGAEWPLSTRMNRASMGQPRATVASAVSVPLRRLTAEEARELVGVFQVQLHGNPLARRLVQKRCVGDPLQIHTGIAPYEPIVLVCEAMAVPLANTADGVAERGPHLINRVRRFIAP